MRFHLNRDSMCLGTRTWAFRVHIWLPMNELAADSVARVCTVINSPVGSIVVAMLEVYLRVEN